MDEHPAVDDEPVALTPPTVADLRPKSTLLGGWRKPRSASAETRLPQPIPEPEKAVAPHEFVDELWQEPTWCGYCGKFCSSIEGYRCMLCNLTVHNQCRAAAAKKDCGMASRPQAVDPVSEERRASTGLIDEPATGARVASAFIPRDILLKNKHAERKPSPAPPLKQPFKPSKFFADKAEDPVDLAAKYPAANDGESIEDFEKRMREEEDARLTAVREARAREKELALRKEKEAKEAKAARFSPAQSPALARMKRASASSPNVDAPTSPSLSQSPIPSSPVLNQSSVLSRRDQLQGQIAMVEAKLKTVTAKRLGEMQSELDELRAERKAARVEAQQTVVAARRLLDWTGSLFSDEAFRLAAHEMTASTKRFLVVVERLGQKSAQEEQVKTLRESAAAFLRSVVQTIKEMRESSVTTAAGSDQLEAFGKTLKSLLLACDEVVRVAEERALHGGGESQEEQELLQAQKELERLRLDLARVEKEIKGPDQGATVIIGSSTGRVARSGSGSGASRNPSRKG